MTPDGATESSALPAIVRAPPAALATRGVLDVVTCPHPFSIERTEIQVPAGGTLADIVALAVPDRFLALRVHVWIGDVPIPLENWRLVRPKPGHRITIRVVPQDGGGGGKNPLRTILTLVVVISSIVIAPYAAPGVAGALGITSATGIAAVTAGIGGALPIAGAAVISAAKPPPRSA